MGVIPIVCKKNFNNFSLAFGSLNDCFNILNIDDSDKIFNDKFFIGSNIQLNIRYGGCSSVVECETVALETRVRFPPFAYLKMRAIK